MVRNVATSVQNNFAKGLITEATGLSFPEHACTETYNCVFDRKGAIARRLGFDLEDGFVEATENLTARAPASYLWTNVAGNGDISFAVVQLGDELHFYKVRENALSANKHATVIDLTTYVPAGVSTVANLECQFSDGNGLLFVTNQRLNSFFVEYNESADTLTGTAITIKIRDFEGDTADALAVDNRPTAAIGAITAAHRYNLQNQGWTTTNLTAWDTARTDMPSNADVNWYFKSATDTFDFSTVADRAVGNSPAPKGHYIYNMYDVKRTDNFAGATDYSIPLTRVATSAFFAGRVFYSGLKVLNQNSKIFFTQIIERREQYGFCYQANDPTSETLFDLLPSDGGVIDIPEAGTVIKMIPVLNTLVVFASNGIWAITGSQGIGFRANDYSITKIPGSQRILSPTSFVEVDGLPYWWNLDGIYSITLDPQSNAFRANSITRNTINTFYDAIPGETKQYARGAWDPFRQEVQWLYKSTTATAFEDRYIFDRILVYNLVTQAFYVWSFDPTDVKLHGIINVTGAGGVAEAFTVADGANLVIDSTDSVISFIAGGGVGGSNTSFVTKYLVSYPEVGVEKVTFGEQYRETYLDWGSYSEGTGESFESYFVTGYAVRGQGSRKFQQTYLTMFSQDDGVDTAFKIRSQWNYSNASSTGKWSSEQTFTNTTGNYDYLTRRIKLRGHGLACQIRVRSSSTTPFNLIGWSVFETGNKWI